MLWSDNNFKLTTSQFGIAYCWTIIIDPYGRYSYAKVTLNPLIHPPSKVDQNVICQPSAAVLWNYTEILGVWKARETISNVKHALVNIGKTVVGASFQTLMPFELASGLLQGMLKANFSNS